MSAKQPIIFIADDDSEDSDLLKDVLLSRVPGSTVTCVEDGQKMMEALKRADPFPDLIILDINMPKKNGFETLQEIHEMPGTIEAAIVMLTASSRMEDEHKCRRLGCKAFLRKPMSYTEYESTADTILSYLK